MAVVSILAAIICAAPSVSAQCNSTSYAADQSVNGSVRMQAVSTQINCSDRRMYVKAWIENTGFSCISGQPESYYCLASNSGGNASVTVGTQSCGYFQGQSRHYYSQSGGAYVNLTPRTTPLYAGDCAAIECAARGPDYYWNGSECVYAPGSPIVIATGTNAVYQFTSPAQGVVFDVNGDGVAEQIAWTEPNSDVAFLALDRDGDGAITNGTELFGTYTLPGSPNGFDALARLTMASNGGIPRASVSSDDPLFAKLLLWTDRNHNGTSEPTELRAASELFSDIGLGYAPHARRDQFGNELRYRGWATIRTAPGRNRAEEPPEQAARRRMIYDVFFRVLR